MQEADSKLRRRKAPLWLKLVITGLLSGILWLGVLLSALALPDFAEYAFEKWWVVFIPVAPSAFVAWLIVRRASTRASIALSVLAMAALGLWIFVVRDWWGATSYPMAVDQALPGFPWPPPAASAFYVLPSALLESESTIGQMIAIIISALERTGYVERSFFNTEDDGIVLVTRLERINDDGSSAAEDHRWPAGFTADQSSLELVRLLKGLFFIEPGHYRIIAFVLQNRPFSQSARKITGEEAQAWLMAGANTLPKEIADLPLGTTSCTVLIYEFASDGSAVRVIGSRLTGRQHLERAGVMTALGRID